MESKETDIDIEKVRANPDQKAHWRKAFEEEAEAKKQLEALEEARKRIIDVLEKAQGDLKALDFSLESIKTEWAEKLLAWAVGKTTRKPVIEHRTRHRELQTLIEDCRAALTIIEKKKDWGFRGQLLHATRARDAIRARLEDA